jgi:putative hydrolase of the HAD superfamily
MDKVQLSNIKAVFMDIGGVFLSNGWDHNSRKKAAETFHFDFDEMEAQHNFIFNVFEIGSISLDQYLDVAVFFKSRDFSKADFKNFMFKQSYELPQILAWAKEWKKQIDIPVFAVNNEGQELNDYRIKTFDLHQLFDGFFSSCCVGARKPDPYIFQTALKIAHIKPEECLYLDDRSMLVDAAKRVGIHAFRHELFEETKQLLEQLIKH